MSRRLWAGVLLGLWLAGGPAVVSWAQEEAGPAKARQELQDRLERLIAERDRSHSRIEQLNLELAQVEQTVAREEASLGELVARETAAAASLAYLDRKLGELGPAIADEETSYGRRLRALYLHGADLSLHLLASSKDYSQALTRSVYLSSLLQDDYRRLHELRRRRDQMAALQTSLGRQQKEDQLLLREMAAHRQKATDLRARRAKLQEQITAETRRLDLHIASTREAEARLVRTFSLDQPAAGQAPAPPPAGTPPPPGAEEASPPLVSRDTASLLVEGVVEGPAGPEGRGLEIKARPGAPVRSPWAGKVVFAAPLNGYGQVVVVDHGSRMHTVLGQLGVLSVEPGRRVASGEVLGSVGPGGRLYLELRREAQPVDPQAWLRLPPGS
ncbi:MAG: peptidoglycan DD-metalloendopeptidase family protein [Deltaproteobacteria bacterium]|nr:peptidoglycan DD-metalloendopeptidase family protein [Deltaproteobacteria bacterium]